MTLLYRPVPIESAEQAEALPEGTVLIREEHFAFPGTREGRAMLTRTRTPAWYIGKHAVVSVEGYAGGIALTHIIVTEETP